MTRDEALAICSANLKGSRDKDLLATARALQYLKSLPEHPTNEKVSEVVGVRGEMVRQFLGLLRLPEPVQQMLEQKRLGLAKGHQLGRLGKRRQELQLVAGEAMAGITAKQARLLVDEILANPHLALPEAMERAKAMDAAPEQRVRIVAMVPKEQHRRLKEQSRRRGVEVDELLSEIVRLWLETNGNDLPV